MSQPQREIKINRFHKFLHLLRWSYTVIPKLHRYTLRSLGLAALSPPFRNVTSCHQWTHVCHMYILVTNNIYIYIVYYIYAKHQLHYYIHLLLQQVTLLKSYFTTILVYTCTLVSLHVTFTNNQLMNPKTLSDSCSSLGSILYPGKVHQSWWT